MTPRPLFSIITLRSLQIYSLMLAEHLCPLYTEQPTVPVQDCHGWFMARPPRLCTTTDHRPCITPEGSQQQPQQPAVAHRQHVCAVFLSDSHDENMAEMGHTNECTQWEGEAERRREHEGTTRGVVVGRMRICFTRTVTEITVQWVALLKVRSSRYRFQRPSPGPQGIM